MELFPSNSNFNFMRARVVSLTLAFLIMAVALGAMAVNGFNYALDFTGGTVAELRFDKRVEAEAVRKHLVSAGFENPVVQTFGTGNDLVVRLKPRPGDGDVECGLSPIVLELQPARERAVGLTGRDGRAGQLTVEGVRIRTLGGVGPTIGGTTLPQRSIGMRHHALALKQ